MQQTALQRTVLCNHLVLEQGEGRRGEQTIKENENTCAERESEYLLQGLFESDSSEEHERIRQSQISRVANVLHQDAVS